MAKLKLCIGVFVMIMIGVAAAGEPAQAQAPETKRIGVVFIQQVFANYQYARDTEARIKSKYQPDQQKIEAEDRHMQEMVESLRNDPLKPPGSQAQRKAMMEIEQKRLDIQAMQEDFIKRVREEEAAYWQNVYNAFQRACKIYAEYYQYDIIIASPDLNLSEDAIKANDPMAIQQEILMRRIQYVQERANLTKPISDLLNHRYQQYLKDPQKNSL